MSRSPRKLKNGESYKKVANLIRETEDYKNLISKVKRRLATPAIENWVFHVNYDGSPYPILNIRFGSEEETVVSEFRQSRVIGAYEFYFEMTARPSMVLRKSELEKVIQDNFGVIRQGERKPRIPTYFCKVDRIKEMMWEEIYQLAEVLEPEFQECSRKMHSMVVDSQAGETYKNGILKAKEDHIVEQITACLTRWAKDASPAVLKRALDSYVMHEIMQD